MLAELRLGPQQYQMHPIYSGKDRISLAIGFPQAWVGGPGKLSLTLGRMRGQPYFSIIDPCASQLATQFSMLHNSCVCQPTTFTEEKALRCLTYSNILFITVGILYLTSGSASSWLI